MAIKSKLLVILHVFAENIRVRDIEFARHLTEWFDVYCLRWKDAVHIVHPNRLKWRRLQLKFALVSAFQRIKVCEGKYGIKYVEMPYLQPLLLRRFIGLKRASQICSLESDKMNMIQLKRWVTRLAWGLGTLRQNPDDVILLTGSPRSGTTWVMELIETVPGIRRIWEPLLFRDSHSEPAHKANFGLGIRPYLAVGENHPELETFLGRLLSGKECPYPMMMGPLTCSRLKFLKRFASKKTIIKFCRAQRLLPWLLHKFDVQTILLIRHPCAVVASQLNHPGFQQEQTGKEHPVISEQVMTEYPDLAQYALNLSHLEEKLAATWCFDYLIPLRKWGEQEDFLLVYERLLVDPENQLHRIERHLGIEFPEDTFQRVKMPSATTMGRSLHVRESEERLSIWKSRLSSEEASRILQVVKRFDINFYTDALEPNYEQLKEFLTST